MSEHPIDCPSSHPRAHTTPPRHATHEHKRLNPLPLLLLGHRGAQPQIGVVLQGEEQGLRRDENVLVLDILAEAEEALVVQGLPVDEHLALGLGVESLSRSAEQTRRGHRSHDRSLTYPPPGGPRCRCAAPARRRATTCLRPRGLVRACLRVWGRGLRFRKAIGRI